MIPKIIHQTWKTKEIPEQWQEAVNACREKHPDFRYILWTDEAMEKFMLKYFPQYYDMYMEYPYNIQRCDAFRYFVLYKYGGIYLDMDIKCKKSLNAYLDNELVFVKSMNITSSYTNSFIMSVPKHPFFASCIQNLETYKDYLYYAGKHFHVIFSTGPGFINKMITQYQPIHKVMPKEDFAGECNVCNNTNITCGNYFYHAKGQSWNSIDSYVINFINCKKYHIITLILIIGLVLILNKHKKKLII